MTPHIELLPIEKISDEKSVRLSPMNEIRPVQINLEDNDSFKMNKDINIARGISKRVMAETIETPAKRIEIIQRYEARPDAKTPRRIKPFHWPRFKDNICLFKSFLETIIIKKTKLEITNRNKTKRELGNDGLTSLIALGVIPKMT